MELIFTSILAFVSTNLDDIFILTLFLGDRRFKVINVYLGQYLGIIALVAVSLIGAVVGNFIDSKYIGLMGLFPIYIGIRQLVALATNKDETDQALVGKLSAGIFGVAMITIANGGDNIGTYIPLFASVAMSDLIVMLGIFLMMTFVWLKLASYLTTHPILAKAISDYGHLITPIVLILLGLFILNENGSFELLK